MHAVRLQSASAALADFVNPGTIMTKGKGTQRTLVFDQTRVVPAVFGELYLPFFAMRAVCRAVWGKNRGVVFLRNRVWEDRPSRNMHTSKPCLSHRYEIWHVRPSSVTSCTSSLRATTVNSLSSDDKAVVSVGAAAAPCACGMKFSRDCHAQSVRPPACTTAPASRARQTRRKCPR